MHCSIPKKILFVDLNQDGTVGGSHFCLLNILKSLNRHFFEPSVVFYEKHKLYHEFNSECKNQFIINKFKGKSFYNPGNFFKYFFLFLQKFYNFLVVDILTLKSIFFFIKNNRVHLIHLNNSACEGWQWLISAKLFRIKCITSERGLDKFGLIDRLRAKYFDKILCVSEAVKFSLEKMGIFNNSEVLYDAIDPASFKHRIQMDPVDVKKSLSLPNKKFLIGMVGNFQSWKGQHVLVNALEILNNSLFRDDIFVIFVGDVSQSNPLDRYYFDIVNQQILNLGLEKNILITGYRNDVPDLMNAFDIVVHASIDPEPFGMVILEAMSLKKLVISTNIGGPKEIIQNHINGILIPPNDAQALAHAIDESLNSNLYKTIGESAFNRICTNFALDNFSIRINNIYKDLLIPFDEQ